MPIKRGAIEMLAETYGIDTGTCSPKPVPQ